MNKPLSQIGTRLQKLPAVYYYTGLGLICASLMVYSFLPQADNENSQVNEQIQSDPYETKPTELAAPSSFQVEYKAGNQSLDLKRILNGRLDELSELLSLSSVNESPDFVDKSLRCTGIDPNGYQQTFKNDRFFVERFRQSANSPVYQGQRALADLHRNIFGNNSTPRTVQIRCYQADVEGDNYVTRILVESGGQVEESTTRQLTSLWDLSWKIESNCELRLLSLTVVAAEKVTLKNANPLFTDVTASVFQREPAWNQQLAYGLDQWARRIPHLDIKGMHGIAIGDVNGDGLDDVYVCQPHGLPNCLLVQQPDGTVKNLATASKVDLLDHSSAALWLDLDNDDDQDLVVATDENLVLFSNKGNSEFQLEHQLAIGKNCQHLTAADFDRDGDLDLFLCKFQDVNRHEDIAIFPTDFEIQQGGRNVLLRNDEGWNFVDVTEATGLTQSNRAFSRSAVWLDYDLDGDQDLFVANEFSNNQLWENQNGWFTEISEPSGLNSDERSRSVSSADFNLDGIPDLLLAGAEQGNIKSSETSPFDAWLDTSTQVAFNNGRGKPFQSYLLSSPIFSSQTSYSSLAVDLDNDTMVDVFFANGEITRGNKNPLTDLFIDRAHGLASEQFAAGLNRLGHDLSEMCRLGESVNGHQRNRCLLGMGTRGFSNISAISGLDQLTDGRAVAATDWDSDGDLDLVTFHRDAPQIRFHNNELAQSNYVQFDLLGTESNRDAIGTRVEVYLGNQETPLTRTLQAGSGGRSQSSKRITVGLGNDTEITKLIVVWPNGQRQTFGQVATNTCYEIVEGRSELAEKTTGRFNLAINARKTNVKVGLPSVSHPYPFFPRVPVPVMESQLERGMWFDISNTPERDCLILFCRHDSQSVKRLENLKDSLSKQQSVDFAIKVAVIGEAESDAENFTRAKQLVEKCSWPYSWGALSASSSNQMELFYGEYFSNQQLPGGPFAVLINQRGQLCYALSQEQLSISNVLTCVQNANESGLLSWDASLVNSTAPKGRWVERYRQPKLNRFRTQLAESNYIRSANRLKLASNPQRAVELTQKAIEFSSEGRLAKAEKLIEKAIDLDPECVTAFIAEGELQLRKSREIKSDDLGAKTTIQQRAAQAFETAIALDPSNPQAIIGRANVSIAQNRTDEALKRLLEYLQVQPDRYEVHAIVGRLFFHQKKYSQAATFLVQAFENRPTLPHVSGDLGFLYLGAGKPVEAKKFLKLANRLQPSDKNIVRLLAEAEFVTGGYDRATELFEQVAKLDPVRRRPKNVLAWLLATCPFEKQRDGEKGIALITPLIELFGDESASTLEIYAACFAENRQFDKAVSFQQKAVDLVMSSEAAENYTTEQKQGMQTRLELYRRNKPYRTANLQEIPIQPAGFLR